MMNGGFTMNRRAESPTEDRAAAQWGDDAGKASLRALCRSRSPQARRTPLGGVPEIGLKGPA